MNNKRRPRLHRLSRLSGLSKLSRLSKLSGLSGLTVVVVVAIVLAGGRKSAAAQDDPLRLPEEKHLRNIRQLTNGGENAEAYFSADGKKLIFQSTRDGHDCDQIYEMGLDGSDVKMFSTGRVRCTGSYFFPDCKRIIYS